MNGSSGGVISVGSVTEDTNDSMTAFRADIEGGKRSGKVHKIITWELLESPRQVFYIG